VGGDFQEPCDAETDGNTVTFSARDLGLYEGMQIVAGYPVGTFANVTPELGYQDSFINYVWPNATSGIIAIVVLVAGISFILFYRYKVMQDEVYANMTPGMRPAPGQTVKTVRQAIETIPVAFTPPEDLHPAESRAFTSIGQNDAMDATLIDLAVRGFVTIEPLEGDDAILRLTGKRDDELVDFEISLLAALFPGRNVTRTADLRDNESVSAALKQAKDQLDTRTDSFKWFKNGSHAALMLPGLAALVAGFLLAFKFVTSGIAAPFVAMAIVGAIAMVTVIFNQSTKSAEGSVAYVQIEGFKKYLSTAEADQLQWEAGQDIFSKYLPWAVAFGVAERWAAMFAQLAAEGRYQSGLTWIHGTDIYRMQNLTSVISAATGSFHDVVYAADSYAESARSSASSGGSGFSGGGGHGGGGSSSW
jgi:uncharacterized membrane protein YgcG